MVRGVSGDGGRSGRGLKVSHLGLESCSNAVQHAIQLALVLKS